MKKEKQHIYKAALYLRLSNQNINEKIGESDSIVNQEALIRSYLKAFPEIQIKSIFKDDGWTGVNFNRPGFQKMMQMVYDSEIDCVVVKDLSRLGRNHTETGKYITRVFPAFGVRFIAVNDHIDTIRPDSDIDNIIIPFKDLLNDSYSRDISLKVRSAQAVLKASGEICSGVAPFGYRIDKDDKKHYVMDPEAADVVRKIYRWTFDGMGSTEIVRCLNSMHVLCPSEHKQKARKGKKYVQGEGEWNVYQIYRILRNDVYTGRMRLGKTTTPNYKVKKIIQVPEEDQYIFEDNHEAIISKEEFALMQDLLSRDARVNAKKGSNAYVYPLSGYIFCGDCGGSMISKNVTSKGHHYRYYVCGNNKNDNSLCTAHTISHEAVEKIVLDALNAHLKVFFEIEKKVNEKNIALLTQEKVEKLQVQIGKILEKKFKAEEFVKNLYRDLKDGILTEEEYMDLKAEFQREIETCSQDAAKLEMEKYQQVDMELSNLYWIQQYKNTGKLTELRRRDVVTFIDRVEVFEDKHVKIRFRFGDGYKKALKEMKNSEDSVSFCETEEGRKEAVNG